MGNKIRKIKRKQAAAILRKTGGVPPVTLAVADPVSAFLQVIPSDPDAKPVTLHKVFQKIVKDVSRNRPQKGPLKKVKLQPKVRILERLSLRKDEEGRYLIDVLPGDPIAHLDGKPFIRKMKVNEKTGEAEFIDMEFHLL
jgi:hypothetical protein